MAYTTLGEVAQKHNVNYHTLRRWLLKSKVKCERVGTAYLIDKRDVRKVLKKGGKCS